MSCIRKIFKLDTIHRLSIVPVVDSLKIYVNDSVFLTFLYLHGNKARKVIIDVINHDDDVKQTNNGKALKDVY